MRLHRFIRDMPKVELHVHLEGAIQPETLLTLARRHGKSLPADNVDGLRRWYSFSDFNHFVEIYLTISDCIRDAEDIELIAREFLKGQAAQNIKYSEVTYTAHTHFQGKGLSFDTQLSALERARHWAEAELGVTMALVIDIPRYITGDEGVMVADWCIEGKDRGVVALGLGGPEDGNPAERYVAAFERAKAAGLASVPHAGETVGAESIWQAVNLLHADRIGHGVRCLDDPELVAALRERQIPLEVCPSSNLCLNLFPSLAEHPLPRLMAEGLYVTLNSDDPPMFNTTLTDEYLRVVEQFGFQTKLVERLVLNGVAASLLPDRAKKLMREEFRTDFDALRIEQGLA